MSAPQRPLTGEQVLQRIGAGATGRELITAANAAAARDAIEAQQQNDGLDFIASSNPTDPGFPPTSIPGSTYVLGVSGWQLTMALNDIQDRYLPEHAIWIGSDGGTSEDFATGAKGRDLLAAADAAAARSTLDLGTAATADVTTSATDTTAGRLLKVGDGGLLGAGIEIGTGLPLQTFQDLVRDGDASDGARCTLHFHHTMGNAPADAPIPAQGCGTFVSRATVSGTRQGRIIWFATTNQRVFTTITDINGNLEPWEEIYHTGNVVGTVSESGGTPTGAIIERGSNANGEWTKFADGTMMQYGVALSNSSGDAREVPLPQDFANAAYAPVISTINLFPRMHAHANRTTTSFEHQTYTDTGGRSATAGRYIAIGRWY